MYHLAVKISGDFAEKRRESVRIPGTLLKDESTGACSWLVTPDSGIKKATQGMWKS